MSVIILGSTGSIGTQAIDVAKKKNIQIDSIAANKNVNIVENQVRELGIKACAMSDPTAAKELALKLSDTNVTVYSGNVGVCQMIEDSKADTVINSIIGQAGLLPTLATIRSKKKLALANKESLVVAGDIVMSEARAKNVPIIPVDSEHCAIHQCLKVGAKSEINKIILTASGGPFYGKKKSDIENVTINEVLAHPTWSMGAKITVDSASLMNKGFEVIEAMHLFGVPASQIDVLVHRESIIHSMVEYIDNSVIAQMSVPDMRFCIQYALAYPDKSKAVIDPLNLADIGRLTFGKPDINTFSLLAAAFEAAEKGGALPAVLNASNEIAVDAFLKGKIKFYDITETVLKILSDLENAMREHSLEGILAFDIESRKKTEELLCTKTLH